MIEFTVPGDPQQQGSKRPGRNRKTGAVIMLEDNADLKQWRALAIMCAKQALPPGWTPIDGPVRVIMDAYFKRPQHHFGTGRNAGVLKGSAKPYPDGQPDLDKLERAVGDVLQQSGVLHDDARIVRWVAGKDYGTPETYIRVEPMI